MDLTENIRKKIEELRQARRDLQDEKINAINTEIERKTLKSKKLFKLFEQTVIEYQNLIDQQAEFLAEEEKSDPNATLLEFPTSPTLTPTLDVLTPTEDEGEVDQPLEANEEANEETISNDQLPQENNDSISSLIRTFPSQGSAVLDASQAKSNEGLKLSGIKATTKNSKPQDISTSEQRQKEIRKAHRKCNALKQQYSAVEDYLVRSHDLIAQIRERHQSTLAEFDLLERQLTSISQKYEHSQKKYLAAIFESLPLPESLPRTLSEAQAKFDLSFDDYGTRKRKPLFSPIDLKNSETIEASEKPQADDVQETIEPKKQKINIGLGVLAAALVPVAAAIAKSLLFE